jgi:hypothetical protein
MASPLDGQIAKAIAKGFRGKLKKGTIRREVPGVGVDALGDPNPGTVATFPFQGIREDYDASFRATAGIPQTDCKILVIAGLTTAVPKQGDQLNISGAWYQCRAVTDIDPATATYTLQCFDIAAPTP